MKLCVAYCRVSTSTKDQNNSIEAQKKYYTELFTNKDYNPANVGMLYKKDGTKGKLMGIFADEGISGTSLKHRQAFNTMIEYAKKKVFDIIYVKSVSRFARSIEDGVKILKDLKDVGVGVYFEDCKINSLDDSQEFVLNFLMGFAQEESRNKSKSIKWGMKRLYEKGGWNGSAPYGYIVENNLLKLNDKESEVVKKIYDLFLNEGNGTGKIARYLNTNNIPTKIGFKWSQKQIMDILKNHIYTGEQRTHITESKDINRKTYTFIEEEEKQIVHQFEYLRIIDDKLFRLVEIEKEKRLEMLNRHTGHSNKNLLSSLLYCSHCGGSYKRKKRHSYRRKDGTQLDIGYEWTCSINDMYGKNRCSHRNMVIETEIIDQIKQEIVRLKNNNMDDLYELYLIVKYDYDVSKSRYKDLIKLKTRVSNEIQILRSDLVEEAIDKDIYREQIKPLNEKAVNINTEISRIENYECQLLDARLKYKQYIDYIKGVDLDNLTNVGLKKIFKNITIGEVISEIGNKGLMVRFNNYCLDMSIEDIFNKAGEMGYKFNVKDIKVESIINYKTNVV